MYLQIKLCSCGFLPLTQTRNHVTSPQILWTHCQDRVVPLVLRNKRLGRTETWPLPCPHSVFFVTDVALALRKANFDHFLNFVHGVAKSSHHGSGRWLSMGCPLPVLLYPQHMSLWIQLTMNPFETAVEDSDVREGEGWRSWSRPWNQEYTYDADPRYNPRRSGTWNEKLWKGKLFHRRLLQRYLQEKWWRTRASRKKSEFLQY